MTAYAAQVARVQFSNSAGIGEFILFGSGCCPQCYIEANGQLLLVGQNTAPYSLYGTMYGGDGRTTFVIPDLRGRAPVSQEQGLPNYTQGEVAGSPTSTITIQNMPAHSHAVNAVSGPTHGVLASGQLLGTAGAGIYSPGGVGVQMSSSMIGVTGGNQPLTTQSPIQAIRWCVAMQGIFCARP